MNRYTAHKERVYRAIGEDGSTYKAIADATGLGHPYVSKLLHELIGEGLIERYKEEGNVMYRFRKDAEQPQGEVPAPAVAEDRGPPAPATGPDLDALMRARTALEGIATGTDADRCIAEALRLIDGDIGARVAPCPFCGERPTIRTVQSLVSLKCGCGAMFAFAGATDSVTGTVAAYNRRIG